MALQSDGYYFYTVFKYELRRRLVFRKIVLDRTE